MLMTLFWTLVVGKRRADLHYVRSPVSNFHLSGNMIPGRRPARGPNLHHGWGNLSFSSPPSYFTGEVAIDVTYHPWTRSKSNGQIPVDFPLACQLKYIVDMATNIFISSLARLKAELGLDSILNSSRDTKLLSLQRFVRLFAYGASTLILALYLSSLGVSDTRIGLFMTLTLLGDVIISFGLTLFADGLGRRKTLVAGAALMSASGAIFAWSGNYWVLVAASILGVISPRYTLVLQSFFRNQSRCGRSRLHGLP